MSAPNPYFAVAAINVSIMLAIAVITIGGLLLTGEWTGLWSLLLALFMASGKTGGGNDKADDE